MCNILTLLHKGKKSGRIVIWVVFSSSFEVNETSPMLAGFYQHGVMGGVSPLPTKIFNALKTLFLAVFIAPVPFLF